MSLMSKCIECNGRGEVVRKTPTLGELIVTCPKCKGTGI